MVHCNVYSFITDLYSASSGELLATTAQLNNTDLSCRRKDLDWVLICKDIGRGGPLVKSMTLNWRVVGSSRHVGTLGKSFTYSVKLRYSIRAVVGSASE